MVLILGRREFLSELLERMTGRLPEGEDGLDDERRAALAAVFSAVVAWNDAPKGDTGAELSSSRDGISTIGTRSDSAQVVLFWTMSNQCHELTSFIFVIEFCVIPYERSLGLINLHQAVFPDLGRSKVLFIPCKPDKEFSAKLQNHKCQTESEV